MAGSRKYRNYYIINDDVLKSGLKGNELLVYALVRSYVTSGIPFDLSVTKIMERTNVGRRNVIDILQRLVAKGLLVKVGQEKEGVTSCLYELGGAESAPLTRAESAPLTRAESAPVQNLHGCKTCTGEVQNLHGSGAESARVQVQNLHGSINNVDNTYSNTFNNTYSNNSSLSPRAREGEILKEKKIGEKGEEEVSQSGNVQKEERWKEEIRVGIMEGWREHWMEQFGEEYLLRGSITQEVSDLTPAIMSMMEKEGKELTQKGAEDFCKGLFRDIFSTADGWQREKWSLRLITRQLNELIKQNKQQRNHGTEQQEGPRKIADASQYVDRI